jgi:hypothetical protein
MNPTRSPQSEPSRRWSAGVTLVGVGVVTVLATAYAAAASARETGARVFANPSGAVGIVGLNPADTENPFFRTNDGSNCDGADVSTIGKRRRAFSLLMMKGLIRVPTPLPIVIRWSPQVPLPGNGAEARRRAGNILRQAGISVLWRECRPLQETRGRTPAECREPLQANEVILRIVLAGSTDLASRARSSLGESLVDVAGNGGWFSTIYADRVTAMARLAGVDSTEVLSCAIAHEIGHLLLGTRTHAGRGLMRALWSVADFRRNVALDWLFSADEARMMRETIARRVLGGL